ncbi:MAG: hypothetical protein LBH82_03390, partial [Bacteroidales bacterium]|nr:hypothetical protein [Bacteroidales bacterium]
MMKIRKLFILWILCSLVFTACKEKDLPDEAFIDFAKTVEKEMRYGNANTAINAFDHDEFERRILTDMTVNAKEKEQALSFMHNAENPIELILKNVKNGADFRFLKFYREDNKPHILFRIYYNGGVSVEDWTLNVKKGQIRISDAFLVVSGIYWSDNYRQQLYNHLNIYTDEVININKLIEVNYLISAEEYEEADSLMYWLMPQMQDNLYARTMELRLASFTDTYENMQALTAKFDRSFPRQKRISTYYLTESAIVQGLPDKAIEQIYALIELLGDDPVYYLYQAWAYQSAGGAELALISIDSAMQYIPGNMGLYLNKMDIYYYGYDFENCVNLLFLIDSLFSPGENDVAFFSE